MANPRIAKAWIQKGDEDLQYGNLGLNEESELYSPICFHFHQSAEKYLKAYIIAKGLHFQKVHDLEKLVEICSKSDKAFDNLVKSARILNPFYIGSRYPDFPLPINRDRAENAKVAAEEIASFVKSKLSISP